MSVPLPIAVKSERTNDAVRRDVLATAVTRGAPFHNTVASGAKFVPSTVMLVSMP